MPDGPPKPKPREFSLGQIVITRNALSRIGLAEAQKALSRHAARDWGELKEHDRRANELALVNGTRLLSVYWTDGDVKFYIITEADRSQTTVLLPEDY